MSALVYAAAYNEDVMPPPGMVPLSDKVVPVCELTEYPEYLAFTRATVDVTAFRAKLASLPPSFWEDENQTGNVQMKRPAHDAWGVKKIVFTFCDDYLTRILDLPFAQDPEWRQFLLPVYKAIGIEERQVVRSLLANMPGGLVIPVHHDTGYWVKHCHRCHLALETGPNVSFTVGPNESQMKRHKFPIGQIVELNNQAKHAVHNEMTSNRIHLIFDYVELEYLETHSLRRTALKPTDKIVQTRRSIDLQSDFGTRKTPSFIIIGVQKCGTTSIYEYLMQHGLAVKGRRRETHFFDWRWPDLEGGSSSTSGSGKGEIAANKSYFDGYMENYAFDALQKHSSLFTGESTPSYILHSDLVIPRIKAIVPWAKLIVIFRNPVERAFSQYQMTTDVNGTEEQLKIRGQSHYVGKSFDTIIKEEIEELTSLGITADSPYEEFRDKYLSTRPLGHGGHSIIGRGLYCLQLIPWLQNFTLNENLLVLELSDIKGDQKKVQTTMNKVYSFVGLQQHEIEDPSAKNTRSYDKMSAESREALSRFYLPFNQKLYSMLGRDYNWE